MRFLVTSPSKPLVNVFTKAFRNVDMRHTWSVMHGEPSVHCMPPRTVWITTNLTPRPSVTRNHTHTVISVPLDRGERPYYAFAAALSMLDGVTDSQRVDWVLVSELARSRVDVADIKYAYMDYLKRRRF